MDESALYVPAWWKSPQQIQHVQLRNVSRDRELERETETERKRKRKRDRERDGETEGESTAMEATELPVVLTAVLFSRNKSDHYISIKKEKINITLSSVKNCVQIYIKKIHIHDDFLH